MTVYRLREDIDLGHYNPSQPRDSHGRWTSGGRVALKPAAYVVNGRAFDQSGHAMTLKAAPNPAAQFLHQTGGTTALKPMPKTRVRVQGDTSAPIKPSIEDVIAHSTTLTAEDFAEAQQFWDKHKVTADDRDADNLSTDLGLDPKYRERSVKELRQAIKDRRTKDEERRALKAELSKRVSLAKAVSDEADSFTNRLTKRFEDAPADADLAPIIGETLAQHPKLGPLAHIWDRLRLSGYNFKKKVKGGEFTDELPRILARNVASVLILGLALHFGVMLPGLGGGG